MQESRPLAKRRKIYNKESCISLRDSTQCPAFNASSISTSSDNIARFSFLSSVTDTASFDSQLQAYIAGSFIQQRFQQLIGCSGFNSSDPTEYYARYTTSVLCNSIIQNSIDQCSLTGQATAPLCADSCALYAQNEQSITSSSACGAQGPNAASQIRADLTNCALPAQSLQQSCIGGAANEPTNCGFTSNTVGLCSYCAAGSPNATDSCCVFSNTETRCKNVHLPISSATSSTSAGPSATSSQTASSSASSKDQSSAVSHGLTGGQIAGLVVGTILGVLLILTLIILACVMYRRRKSNSRPNSVFNQPTPPRKAPSMSSVQHDGASTRAPEAVEALPGGRVTRMSAIDGGRDEFDAVRHSESHYNSPELGSPFIQHTPKGPPPLRGKRSLMGGSALAYDSSDESSPQEDISSPEGTGQSEQLAFFKDYYSQDEVHTGDLVSTLWAYQPRAQDEFELERGDMLKVVGIWDDGWATGVRVRTRADRWQDSQSHRDSGVDQDEDADDEVKAFPLVCVCLPRYWRQTIEGETDNFDSPDSHGGL
ncbi:hypothetical protein K461DRAFT_327882 [Myriangium duriaei CBS 260.36]|uniref:SH3 domain-containing protein n=1 Tax=Myriangium duriaei CBS 260.36 TaxID=1168546 RepID=A0A9P4MJR2_9PEZI|nr:hypothetical protein K461DRAFT_327882 [Myriangium duriaei CBS 260.36]